MAKKQTQTGLTAENAEGNVDKIREILFGGQMRDYEQRFAEMEKRLSKNIDMIANNLEKRIERLNTYARREIEKLGDQIKEERKARRDDGKQGSRELKDLGQQVETWIAELEDQIGTETQDLRGLLQEQSDELSGMIRATHEEMSSSLASETRSLADAKLAREDMAALLTEEQGEDRSLQIVMQVPANDVEPERAAAQFRPDAVLWDLGWEGQPLLTVSLEDLGPEEMRAPVVRFWVRLMAGAALMVWILVAMGGRGMVGHGVATAARS